MENTYLRTPKTWEAYQNEPVRTTCLFCEARKSEWTYWQLRPNDFPYDRIAVKHDLLYPIRHVAVEQDLTDNERRELEMIKHLLLHRGEYDVFWWNFPKAQTVPGHLHFHLLELHRV